MILILSQTNSFERIFIPILSRCKKLVWNFLTFCLCFSFNRERPLTENVKCFGQLSSLPNV